MSTRAASMQTDDIAHQLNTLSLHNRSDEMANKKKKKENKPRKPRKPRHTKAKANHEPASQDDPSLSSTTLQPEQNHISAFQHQQDQHAAFPPRSSDQDYRSCSRYEEHQQYQIPQKQEAGLIRYVPVDSRPDSTHRPPPTFQPINRPLSRDPFPTFQPINRHPSSFFVPSYQPAPTVKQPYDFEARPVPFFSQTLQTQELPQVLQTPIRRSTRLQAREVHAQLQHLNTSNPAPLPLTPAQGARRAETRSSRRSGKRPQKIDAVARPIPTHEYLNYTMTPSVRLNYGKSLLVILDLNGVLVLRKRRTQSYTPRPNLYPFLDYLFSNHHVMVWSSAKPENVEGIIERMIPEHQRNKLVAVWSRDRLRLSADHFNENVQVYKQLSWVWEDETLQRNAPPQGWTQNDTVLVDDSLVKAAAEPYNLIEVDEFVNSPAQSEDRTLMDVVEYLEHLRWYDNVSAESRRTRFALGSTLTDYVERSLQPRVEKDEE